MSSCRVYRFQQRPSAPHTPAHNAALNRQYNAEKAKSDRHDAGQQRLREQRQITVLPLDLLDNLNQKWPIALHESWHDHTFAGTPAFKQVFITYLDAGLPDQLLISSPEELDRVAALAPEAPVAFVLSALRACRHNGDRGHDLYDILIWRVARDRSLEDTSARTGHSKMAVDLLGREAAVYVRDWCQARAQVLLEEAAAAAVA